MTKDKLLDIAKRQARIARAHKDKRRLWGFSLVVDALTVSTGHFGMYHRHIIKNAMWLAAKREPLAVRRLLLEKGFELYGVDLDAIDAELQRETAT